MENHSPLKKYKRNGKKLVPPIMQALGDKLVETSYINDVIPNIIWIAILMQRYGPENGTRIAIKFLNIIYSILKPIFFINYAMISNFYNLTSTEQEIVLASLRSDDELEGIIFCFEMLNELFSDSPVYFFGKKGDSNSDKVYLLRKSVGSIMDKFGSLGVIAQSPITYARDKWGTAGYADHIPPLKLDDVFKDQDSDEFQSVGGRVRISALMEFFPADNAHLKGWPHIFWREAFFLDKCMSERD